MREIIFRGKDRTGIMNHLWQEGSLDNTNEEFPKIVRLDRWGNKMLIDVAPETVGQFTGLTDKNGKKIFEGDIVSTKYKLGRGGYYVFEVYYNENLCQFSLTINSGSYTKNKQYDWLQLTSLKANKVEIIGNIHDKPELLKGGPE